MQQDAFARPQMDGRLFPLDRLEINITLSRFNRLSIDSHESLARDTRNGLKIRYGIFISNFILMPQILRGLALLYEYSAINMGSS